MKISIGPLKIHISIGSRPHPAAEAAQEQPNLWSTGISTCRTLYPERADLLTSRLQQISQGAASSSTSSPYNNIMVAIENTLPPPKTNQEAAYQSFIRHCLTTTEDTSVTNAVQQLLQLLHIPPEPYQLPSLQPLALEAILVPIAKLGESFVNEASLGTPIDQRFFHLSSPFIEYLKGRKIRLYTEALIHKVENTFNPETVPWIQNCEIINQLILSILGLQYLKHPSLIFEGELYKAVTEIVEELPSVIEQLTETLQKLEKTSVLGSGGLSFVQLNTYHEFAKRHFNAIMPPSSELTIALHVPQGTDGHAHAISIDPTNRRFFVHLKKKGDCKTSVLENDQCKVHKALMVSDGQLTLIQDIVYEANVLIRHDIALRKIFADCPYLVSPPIAITHYPQKNSNTSSIAYSSSQSQTPIEKTALFENTFDTNLSAWMEDKRTDDSHSLILDIFYDAAQGMHRLHSSRLLHGDINPQNIFIKFKHFNGTPQTSTALGNLRYARRVGHHGKLKYIHARTDTGKKLYTPDGLPLLCPPKFMGNAYYAPPECGELMNEPQSLAADIWAFGIALWQAMYSEDCSHFPFQSDPGIPITTLISELTQYHLNKCLRKRMPTPSTTQEAAIQNLIQRCLKVSPHLRLTSTQLIIELEAIKKDPSEPYTSATTSAPNIHELFQPFTELEEQRMGQRSGGKVVRSLRCARSYINLPLKGSGSRSLPPELFKVFSKQGELREHLNKVEKIIRKSFLSKTLPIEEIDTTWILLIRTRSVLEKLKKLINKFQPAHADLLINHREDLIESSTKLDKLKKWIEDSIVLHSGGLTYSQVKYYRKFLETKLKIFKEPLGTFGEENYERPIAHHFPKNSEKGLVHAVSLDPITKSLFIHLKKTDSEGRELGKGAFKSVHKCVRIQSQTIEECADAVIRLDEYDDREEQLKLLFKDCPYIEDSADVVALYTKEEIPNLWKSKKDLDSPEIETIKQEQTTTTIQKLAFFPPFYQSFSKLSYHKGSNRDIDLLVKILGDVAVGLSVMHEHRYIHRDIKPGNVLLKTVEMNGNKTLIGVLADLGEATLVAEDNMIPASISMAGTLHYNAPETCIDQSNPRYQRQSFATDIWAFGILICQALYGQHGRDLPFIDNKSQVHIFAQLGSLTQEMIDNALSARFSMPKSEAETRAQNAIRQCLRLDPSERPNAESLIEILRTSFP